MMAAIACVASLISFPGQPQKSHVKALGLIERSHTTVL